MKCLYKIITAIATCAVAVFALSSCIFDAPGDRFYRTLWKSDEVPLGPFPVDKLTVEFLCGQGICITAEDSSSGTLTKTTRYGTYETDGHKAIIEGVTMTLWDHDITFIEARLEGKTLFLLWRIEDSVYPFTTPMQHLSAYE